MMGLKNGNAIFQRVMEHVLREIPNADPHVDDLVIGSRESTEEELIRNHEADLRRVLDTFAQQQLVVSTKKVQMFLRQVEFCGHILEGGGRRPAPGKLLAIQKWERPETITALRVFLGLANYYSCNVPLYSGKAAPLMGMLCVS